MRIMFCACVAIFLAAFFISPRTSRQDVEMPLLIRLLRGLHTEARETEFYTTPAFSRRLEWFHHVHFRTQGPRMSGFDDVLIQPTLLRSSRNAAPSHESGKGGSPMTAGWRIEALACIPFGVLFAILLTRAESQASSAQARERAAAEKAEPLAGSSPAIAVAAVRGQQAPSSRPRQTSGAWICT